jgi:hypothetical protein
MNTQVEEAFRSLESKGGGSGSPLERYTAEHWLSVEHRLPGYGPSWYRQLTQRFCVGGAYFDYPIDPERDYIGECVVWRPSWMVRNVDGAHFAFPELYRQGFFCFADGRDGNVWMFRNDAGDDPAVFFLELSGWDGGAASTENGLIAPALTLSQLLRHGAA